jgi:hypothetical protein
LHSQMYTEAHLYNKRVSHLERIDLPGYIPGKGVQL